MKKTKPTKPQRKRHKLSPDMFLITRLWEMAMEEPGVRFTIRLRALNTLSRFILNAYPRLNARKRVRHV